MRNIVGIFIPELCLIMNQNTEKIVTYLKIINSAYEIKLSNLKV